MRLLVVPALLLVVGVGCAAQERLGTAPAPGPATLAGELGQQVLLHHCGVQPVTYESRSWEVEEPPFDATNAPDTFSGFGTFRRTDDVLLFTDRDGARLTFTPDDGTPDPYTCA